MINESYWCRLNCLEDVRFMGEKVSKIIMNPFNVLDLKISLGKPGCPPEELRIMENFLLEI